MNSTLKHFCHPDHPLRLKENNVISKDATCYACNKSVIGSPTYTCTSDDINCRSFYLHKSCAELPTQINNYKHKHPLTLLRRTSKYACNICRRLVTNLSYACVDCDFDACLVCAFLSVFDSEQKVLHHEGHKGHALKLQREALFECDACGVKAKDSSYVCITCDFWIHKSCVLSPLIIPAPTYHHHPLNLVYNIPEIHRYFYRLCNICDKFIVPGHWLYYCHRCTYFVHMKCATSTVSLVTEIETNGINNEPDLVQFPLESEESLFDLIIVQCGKLLDKFQGERVNNATKSTIGNDPHVIEEHWSHINHPLEQLEFTVSENDSDNYDDRKVLICDGCIQPITKSHPLYYACIQCGFFLHSFCATKLPRQMPAEAFAFHRHHSLQLRMRDKFYFFVKCSVCKGLTNGFFYACEICGIIIDIRCAFMPTRIKYKPHKRHSLVQRPKRTSKCSLCGFQIQEGRIYACETCSLHVHMACAFYPSRMKHRYDNDLHPITLRYPPFYYEGVIYCEICEEPVHNQWMLYHCGESDHSYHRDCLRWDHNFKLGGTIKHSINNQTHTLTLVLKTRIRSNSPRHFCGICKRSYEIEFFFECDGCGFMACHSCVIDIHGECSSIEKANSEKMCEGISTPTKKVASLF